MKKTVGFFQDKTWDDVEQKYVNIRPKKLTIPGISSKGFIYELNDNIVDPLIDLFIIQKLNPLNG